MYTLVQRPQFDDHDKKQVISIDQFHSQFQLSLDKYIDNNNFIFINTLKAYNDWRAISRPQKYRFYDYTANPVWTGKHVIRLDRTVSYDQGKTWVKVQKT